MCRKIKPRGVSNTPHLFKKAVMIFINLDSFQVPSGRKKRRKRAREKRVSLSI